MPFVIVDPARSLEEHVGFAKDDPVEGWIFTTLMTSATRFPTQESAEKAVKVRYPNQPQLQVKETSK